MKARRITRTSCRPAVELCPFCGRDPWADDVNGCIPFDVRGRARIPLQWPPDLADLGDDSPCSCGALPGHLHHADECTLEICPWADDHPDDGEQLKFCGCAENTPP